eukprot:TRINITY_DN8785_c0_g1_i1.p1 TRINITY_DN8785_c0_g1~~TRINITY_DN8785_c0_g1_i1.p1  ORF type:complete len:385 (+),score=77.15 TRINITY_DN8785_c0_g1_i1:44-1198(+)
MVEPPKIVVTDTMTVPEWTVEEVVMWVNKIGFKEHSAAFADSSVDGDILLALSDADIRDDIGITNGIQRKRFMRELKNLKKNADYGCADDHGATANFLAKISPDFRAYTYNLVNNDLSYDYLLRLDPSSLDDMLKYVGIESAIHRHKIVEAVVNASEDEDTMLERLYLDSSEPTDIYISYPRAGGGAELASLISMQMQIKGYKVISAPHDGKTVSEAVKNQVRGSKFYVLILPVGALDNCLVTNSNSQGESQYQPCRLYWEVTTALQHGIDIIPVTLDFQWPEMTELPAEMRALCHYNFVRWAHEYQDHCIDRLEKYMHQDPNLLRTNADSPSTILTRTSGRSTPQIQLAASPRMKPRHRTPSVDSAIGGFSPAPSTTFLSGLM